jgi:hypothetical protein
MESNLPAPGGFFLIGIVVQGNDLRRHQVER